MNTTLQERIEHELEEVADVEAVVELSGKSVVLTGVIDSENQRQAAYDIVHELAPEHEIVDNLEIVSVLPSEIGDIDVSDVAVGDFEAATPGTEDNEALEPGDFTDQPILENPVGAAGPGSYIGGDEATDISEGEEVYVPPIDPVLTRDNEVLGGFQLSSMDEVEVEASALDGTPGDEAIAEAVLRELREDAATTDLELRVRVSNGVVHIRGTVPTLADSENAEEVAYRVPGVTEVVDETKVADLG